MKIAFELSLLLYRKTGVGQYCENIVRELVRLNINNEVTFYGVMFDFLGLKKSNKQLRELKLVPRSVKWLHYGVYRRLWSAIPIKFNRICRNPAEIHHFFNYIVPPYIKGYVVLTVYDLVYLKHPDTMSNRNLRNLKMNFLRSIDRADLIITISEASKQEIIQHLNIEPDKVKIVPPAVDHKAYCKLEVNEGDKTVEIIKNKYNLPDNYLLYLGTLEPRKNIESIIKAYSRLSIELKEQYKLVIAGGAGWKYETIYKLVDELGLKDTIVFTGFVDEEHKTVIYNLAEIFVFPSLYEGFGMPPLEAMACGVPTIVSNIPSLSEVVNDSAIKVEPHDINVLKESISMLLTNEVLRRKYSELGISRASNYTWENSSMKLMEYYRDLVDA